MGVSIYSLYLLLINIFKYIVHISILISYLIHLLTVIGGYSGVIEKSGKTYRVFSISRTTQLSVTPRNLKYSQYYPFKNDKTIYSADVLLTKVLRMVEALDVDPYIAYDIFTVNSVRRFYEYINMKTGLPFDLIRKIIFPFNNLVNWDSSIFELAEIWRLKGYYSIIRKDSCSQS